MEKLVSSCGFDFNLRRYTLELFAWAVENGCPLTVQTCAEAAAGGRLEVRPARYGYRSPDTV
jgi:hypothetical protein